MKKIYLGIPYTFNPKLSFKIANKVAGELMMKGYVVFSPISHSHPISKYIGDYQLDHDFWMKQDLPFLADCDGMIVVVPMEHGGYNTIKNSKGLQKEIQKSQSMQQPIWYIEYYQNKEINIK